MSVADGRLIKMALHATDTFSAVIRCPAVRWLAVRNAGSWDEMRPISETLEHALFSKNIQKVTDHQESSEQAQGATTNSDQKRRCFV